MMDKLKRQQLKHLLWTYHLFKTYDTEEQATSWFKTNAKMLRKWVWAVASKIAALKDKVVS